MIERMMPAGARILQVGKEYYPHPDFKQKEYYVFINYNARLASVDGYTPWRPRPRHEQEFIEREGILFRHATHVFTAGEYLRQDLIREEGVKPERVTAVGNGVHPFYLANPPPTFRESFTNTLLFVGWDLALKGGRYLLEAMGGIRRKYPDVNLIMVGPDEDQRLAQGLLGCVPGVRWVGPVRRRESLLDYFRAADLFVMPSLRDSYGFVFLEAMSQGAPCIGADINGMPEIIEHGKTGYIVPRKSSSSIVEAVFDYYGDPENKRRMAEATYRRLHERFTWDVVMGKINRIIGI